MSLEIPEPLKSNVPQTFWGKVLGATPVVMTVVATLLAGLSSTEMTKAQYERSLAAQQQSKAGDQWNFFQAKRLRGAMQQTTLDILQATTSVRPLDLEALQKVAGLDAPLPESTIAAMREGQLPSIAAPVALDASVKVALEAVEEAKPDAEIAAILAKLDGKTLQEAIGSARERARALDAATGPINRDIDRIEKTLRAGDTGSDVARGFSAARLRYTAARYDAEARLNMAVAVLYELQVRKSNITAERFHNRSYQFFYGMLAAQAAVIVSTFAIAARQRNLLWAFAAAAGIAAILFALYVYLYV